MEVRLLKPLKGLTITFAAELVARTPSSMTVRAPWGRDRVDLGLFTFEPGDVVTEHYYSDRWYNIFVLHDADGRLKGWYCNVTRPAVFGPDQIESEDLELDLLVAPDRRTMRLDDEDEFAARALEQHDPAAHAAALAAVATLRDLVRTGAPPFDETPG